MADTSTTTAAGSSLAEKIEKIQCEVCAASKVKPVPMFETLFHHIKSAHSMTQEAYKAAYPGKPLMSAKAQANLKKAQEARNGGVAVVPATEGAKAKPESAPLKFGVAKLQVREELSAYDQKFVPSHDEDYEFHDPSLEVLALAIQDDENVMLVGPTGCGKTTFIEEMAALLNQPVQKASLNADTRVADFLGEKIVEVDPATGQAIVIWKNGMLPDAMIRGHWFINDEYDACPPGIAFALQTVLEERTPRRLVLAADGGRVVEAHPNFRIFATCNTIGKGDDTGLYTGTQIMNEASLDRFGTTMQVTYLKKDLEIKVLMAKAKVTEQLATKMVECANMVRGGLETEACFCTFSTRRLIGWARKTQRLAGRHWAAAAVTVFNKLSKDDRAYVEGIIQRVMGK